MDSMIIRQAAIDAVSDGILGEESLVECVEECNAMIEWAVETLKKLPSAQPDVKPISYLDCSNAMLKMWMDNILTDGEYYRIMDKLNKHEIERREV